MTFREAAFALALMTASGSVTYGAGLVSTAAGFIIGGLLLGAIAWIVLSE